MTTLTTEQITASVEDAWTKLNAAIQRDLDAINAGDGTLNASNAASVLKFISLSAELIKTLPYMNYQKQTMTRPLPVFEDEPFE